MDKGHLKVMLETLREYHLKEKFSNYHFWRSEVRFLKHVLLENGFNVIPIRVLVVQDWKTESASRFEAPWD